jgi:DNA polymerase III delta prime subunit
MYKKLTELAPEQIFLLQGQETFFDTLVETISEKVVNLEYLKLSRFTKEDAQTLVTFNLERGGGAWCLVYFDVFMSDASQILLKTLEEPKEGIHIALVTPHPYLVPQTIRSRARLILTDIQLEIPKYLSSKKTMADYIKNVIGNEDIDAGERRAQGAHLLDNIEYFFKKDYQKVKTVYEAKEMLFKANMSTKQVVEYVVALVL